MFDFTHVIMFVFSSVGMAHIVVDSSIMEWFRNLVKFISEKVRIPKFGGVVDCYLCCGVWCGFLMGWVWLTNNVAQIIACGFAGGLLSNVTAVLLNWIEAMTVVYLPKENDE